MKKRSLLWSALATLSMALLLISCGEASSPAAGAAVDEAIERRVDSLLSLMTLEEKIGQLNQYSSTFDVTGPAPEEGAARARYEQIRSGQVGSMLNVTGAEATREAQQLAVEHSRLGIPLLLGLDVIHGYRTMFPIPLGESASWDLEAIETSARVAAREATAAGIHWTFAPMVDVAPDARWGRIMEGAGEDPYLGAQAAAARVRGFQGNDLAADTTLAACAKHFAGYGFAIAGRDYNTVDVSEQTLRNVILPPFKACADAGVASFMNAFNEIGGIPATGDRALQRDILKGEWNFDGLVVSDWGSIGEMVNHGFAEDLEDAARLAIRAGSDMDMESGAYVTDLVALVENGQVDEALIDEAARRVLRIKFRLGLFDDPYKYSNAEREEQVILSEEHQSIARDVARKSIVLLKNEGDLLPLSKDAGTIAVIGPLAADKDVPLGSWRAQAIAGSAVSLLEGVEAAVSDRSQVLYAKGADLVAGDRSFVTELTFNTSDKSGFDAARAIARRADVVLLAIGEDCFQTGEGRSQTDIGLKGVQEELMKEIYNVNNNVVVVLMNGRPMTLNWMAEQVPAIVEAWYLGSQAGHAIADVLFGDYNPSGKLPVSFPYEVGQEPLYYNHKNTGRPTGGGGMVFWSHYTDAPNEARFPFGYGLSFTSFEYSDITLSSTEMSMDGELEVSVTVTNAGDRAGAEVVQLYIRDLVASATRPVKELKGFQKIELEPGESRTVTFTLTAEDLAFYTPDGSWTAEPGAFKVFVGTNSRDVKEGEFRLE
jgi:beta-glucosidase